MKNLILLFVLLSSFYSSQEYYFDYKCYDLETQLKGRYKGSKRTNIIYFNSKNKDIMAYDYFFSQQPERHFWLNDYTNNTVFSFSINLKSHFSSLKFIQMSPIKIYSDEQKIEKVEVENRGEHLWIVKTYPNEKSKKTNLELKIVIEKSTFPMPKIRFMDLSLNIHTKVYNALLSKLDSENYRIVDVITDYKNGVIMHDDFSKCEKVNLKILTSENSKIQDGNKATL